MPNSYDRALNISKRQGRGRRGVPASGSSENNYIITKVFTYKKNIMKGKKLSHYKRMDFVIK